MYKKVFLDANVLIDSQSDNRSRHKESIRVLKYLFSNRISVYTSCDLITTIYYILAKKDKQMALLSIEKINKFCNIIEFSNSDIEATCRLMREDKDFIDLEDTMQYILAMKEGCDLIISNDKNFKSKEIKLLNTEEFCKSEGIV